MAIRQIPILVWVEVDDEDEDDGMWNELIKALLESADDRLTLGDALEELVHWNTTELEILPQRVTRGH